MRKPACAIFLASLSAPCLVQGVADAVFAPGAIGGAMQTADRPTLTCPIVLGTLESICIDGDGTHDGKDSNGKDEFVFHG